MHSDDRANARQPVKDSRNASPVATLETLTPGLQTVGAAGQQMTAWKEAWLARTGTLPTQDAANGHPAAGNETAGQSKLTTASRREPAAVTRSGADFGADVRPALATNRPNAAEGDLSGRESVGLSSLGPT